MANENLLQQLKPLHLPDSVSWWPLAPGWYVIMALVIVLAWFAFRYWQQRKQQVQRREVLSTLSVLDQAAREGTQFSPMQLSVLLKRASLAVFPRSEVAGLYGEAWLRFLDKTGNTKQFSQGVGRALLNAPYQARPQVDNKALLGLVRKWFQTCI